MFKEYKIEDIVPQVRATFEVLQDTIPFIKENNLLAGIFEHKWISLFIVIVSSCFSLLLIGDFIQYFSSVPSDAVLQSSLALDSAEITDAVKKEGKSALFSGGTKYLFLIALEVIIFYFSVRTLSILTGKIHNPTFVEFVRAEERMIKVMLRNFIRGIIALVFIYIALSILGLTSLTSFFMFFVYSYFIGFAFFDNYNEQFNKTIKESDKLIKNHRWASTALGLMISGLMYIPIVGPLSTPLIGSIAATMYGNRFQIDTLELIG